MRKKKQRPLRRQEDAENTKCLHAMKQRIEFFQEQRQSIGDGKEA